MSNAKKKENKDEVINGLTRSLNLSKSLNNTYSERFKREEKAKEESLKHFKKSLALMIGWTSETYDIPVEGILDEVKEMLTAIELNDKYDM